MPPSEAAPIPSNQILFPGMYALTTCCQKKEGESKSGGKNIRIALLFNNWLKQVTLKHVLSQASINNTDLSVTSRALKL